MSNKTLILNLKIKKEQSYTIDVTSKKFSLTINLDDQDITSINKLINFILDNIQAYEKIEIKHSETKDVEKDICESFKKIIEEEFDNIKKDIQKCNIVKS